MNRTTITDIRTVAVAVADQDRAIGFYLDGNTLYVVETMEW